MTVDNVMMNISEIAIVGGLSIGVICFSAVGISYAIKCILGHWK